jgi:predicted phosphodiesterase
VEWRGEDGRVMAPRGLAQTRELKNSPIKGDNLNLSATAAGFPESPTRDFTEEIKITCPSAIIIGDAEIPDHDREIFAMAAEMAHRLNIRTLIINGDFIEADAFSKWPKISDTGQRFPIEIDLARATIKEFLKYFNKIYITAGNHERRLARGTSGAIWLNMLMEGQPEMQISEYSHLEMETPAGKWIIAHPANYSRVPLGVAREMAAIKQCNILLGHTHHLSMGHDRSGKWWILDGGCCRNPIKTGYKRMNTNTYPEWIPGFVIIKEGVPLLVSKRSFDVISRLF